MYKNLTKIPTLNMSHDEWLTERRNAVGGSDAASIIGLNPWSSPYTVWADKLGKLPPKEDNEAMRLGRDLEDYVAKRFTEQTGKKVRRENAIIRNDMYPFAHANVDRMVIGEDAGLECKTTSVLNEKRFKNGAFPDTYYVQCVHYMMVTGCKKWYLAVLVLGKEFRVYEIERDEAEINALAQSEEEFWSYVKSQTPPPADGSKATTETITKIFPNSTDETVGLSQYERDLREYVSITAQIKALDERRNEAVNKVKAYMNTSAKGESENYKVSWATVSRSNFDVKKFAAEHRNINLDKYYNKSTYRTFKVTEKGE